MNPPGDVEPRVLDLRRAFDDSFAAPPRSSSGTEALLAIRTGAGRFLVPLGEIAGVHRALDIVPLPRAIPGLLGVAGIRRRPVAVYSAASLLGAAGDRPARWLLVAREDPSLALAVEELEGTLHASPAEIQPLRAGPGEHVTRVLEEGGEPWGVLSLASLVALARSRAG